MTLKIVTSAETINRIVRTNVMGAENVVKASIFNEVTKVIALSTDGANPINLYGQVGIRQFCGANNYSSNQTTFSVVR